MDADGIPQTTPYFFSPSQVAALLAISKATLYRLVEKRTLPFYKIGGSLRFKHSDIVEYVERCRIQSAHELYEHTQTRDSLVR